MSKGLHTRSLVSGVCFSRIIAVRLLFAAVISGALAVGTDLILHAITGPTSAGTGYNKYWIVFFFCIFFIGAAILLLRKKLDENPEQIYLVAILLLTVLFAWSSSPWQISWDDGVFFRSAVVFSGASDPYTFTQAEEAIIGFSDPLTKQNAYLVNERSLEGLYSRQGVLDGMARSLSSVTFSGVSLSVGSVAMWPMAFAMAICKALSLPFTVSFFLSKLPCALIYSVLTFFGMRKLRGGKALFAVVALTPTNVFLASNYSYSYWTYGLILFGFAYLASMLQSKEPVGIKDIVLMLVSLSLACFPRIVYFPLILVCLVVPRSRFSSRRASVIYRVAVLSVTLLTAALFFAPVASSGLGAGDSRGGETISPSGQVAYILSHPVEFVHTLCTFLFAPFGIENGSPDMEGHSVMSGFMTPEAVPGYLTNFGYLPRPSRWFAIIIMLLLALTALTDKDSDEPIGILPGLVSAIICMGVGLMIITYMYMVFNGVGAEEIRGVQRRYFLPLLYPVLAFIGSRKWNLCGRIIPKSVYNGGTLCIMTVICLACWWQVYLCGLN